MGSDESRRTDLIYPHRFMGWRSERLTFLAERTRIENRRESVEIQTTWARETGAEPLRCGFPEDRHQPSFRHRRKQPGYGVAVAPLTGFSAPACAAAVFVQLI